MKSFAVDADPKKGKKCIDIEVCTNSIKVFSIDNVDMIIDNVRT